ncbi:hypothetical protein K6U64_19895 [Vibrio vulnificus]|uniref:hypothetical protein n=1 Tax=Vibrio vulnificus TaxID=672 RepID=UPI001EEC9E7A|nr:hypothetical protein [Vibrio vulnificus]MCG6265293.1 hypothetical protein [Vibrio vulnificus]
MDKKQNKDMSIVSLTPILKSKTAFLIDGLDRINTKNKPYHVEVWDFSSSHAVGVRYSLTVRFSATNPAYVNGIQDALYKIYHHSKKTETLPLSVTQMDAMKYALQGIADCLEGTNWSCLENYRKWAYFIRKLKNKKLGVATVGHAISALNKLTAIGELKSYVDAQAMTKCASDTVGQQNVAIPHRLYQCMMNHALAVVEKYHPYRHDISKAMGDLFEIKKRVEAGERICTEGRGTGRVLSMEPYAIRNRIKIAVRKKNHGVPDFKVDFHADDLADILTSCLVIVQGFSGVRIGEAVSFNKDSIDRVTINGKKVTVLQGETTKGTNGKPKKVTWQSHFIAETALELAYDMMASTRDFYLEGVDKKEEQGEVLEKINHMRRQLESAFLVVKATRQSGDNYIFDPQKALKRFIKNLGYKVTLKDVEEFNMLNPTREGDLKVGGTYDGLSSHDFRRTFAVFFVRYGFGTPSGIKFQFKHENINMSGYYANNAELAQMNDLLMDEDILDDLKEAGIDLGIDIFDEIYNQSEHLSGAKGEKIMQDRMKKLQSGESIIMTREEIEENLRRGNFHIMQLPSGAYCTNGSCDRVCGTLSFRAEIKECEHKVVTDKSARMIAKQRDRLIAKFTDLNTGDPLKSSILNGLKQKIQVEELTLKAHEIPYTPFNDDIRARNRRG